MATRCGEVSSLIVARESRRLCRVLKSRESEGPDETVGVRREWRVRAGGEVECRDNGNQRPKFFGPVQPRQNFVAMHLSAIDLRPPLRPA